MERSVPRLSSSSISSSPRSSLSSSSSPSFSRSTSHSPQSRPTIMGPPFVESRPLVELPTLLDPPPFLRSGPLLERPLDPLPPFFTSQTPSLSSFSKRQPPKSSPRHSSVSELETRQVVSRREWAKIRMDDANSTARFPRYQYDSSLSRLIVQLSPSPLHESVVSAFSSGFNDVLASMPRPARKDFMISSGKEFIEFGGKYEGSVKVPDLALELKDANGFFQPLVVLEVGMTETYEELLEDIHLWMSCDSIQMIIILNVKETQRYRFPENARDRMPTELASISKNDFHLLGAWGPVIYQGYTFVDAISEALLEVWTKSGKRAEWDILSVSPHTILPVIDDFGLLVNLDVGLLQSYLKASLKQLALARVFKGVGKST